MGRLGLGQGLGPKPHVVGQLRLGVWVSVSFQIFALTARENVLFGEGNCPCWGMSGGDMPEGTFPTLLILAITLKLTLTLIRWVSGEELLSGRGFRPTNQPFNRHIKTAEQQTIAR